MIRTGHLWRWAVYGYECDRCGARAGSAATVTETACPGRQRADEDEAIVEDLVRRRRTPPSGSTAIPAAEEP